MICRIILCWATIRDVVNAMFVEKSVNRSKEMKSEVFRYLRKKSRMKMHSKLLRM